MMKKTNQKEAPINRRVFAYLIDISIELIVTTIFTLSSRIFMFEQGDMMLGSFQVLCLVVFFGYAFVYFPIKNVGQTMGKKVMNIKVVKENDRDIKLSKSIIREYLFKFILFPFFIAVSAITVVYYIVIKKGNSMQYLHDVFLKTKVIDC